MKVTEEQQRWVDRLRAKHAQIKERELGIRDEVERRIAVEMNVLHVERSQIANEALAAGVSKTRIGKAMNTSDWLTVRRVLELTAESRAEAAEQEKVGTTPPVEAADRAWTYYPDSMKLIVHQWRENGSNRPHEDALEVPMYLTDAGRLDAEYNRNHIHGVTKQTTIEVWLWSDIREAVNVAMGLAKPPVQPEVTVWDPDAQDEFTAGVWANYNEDEDEYRESE